MKGKLKEKLLGRWLVYGLLALFIGLGIVRMCVLFGSEKKLYHCDELYSYGLSNSFYRPFVESNDVYAKENDYIGEWYPASLHRDYLTVGEGQQFRYDSVLYNQSCDRHPPLYYAVLHTLCSFYPGGFSFVTGFALNLVIFAVTQFFLFLLVRKVTGSQYASLLAVGLWSLTSAAADITLFVRMYDMLTMWTVIFFWLHSGLTGLREKLTVKKLLPLTGITALGALTQHLFLFPAFVTAVCFCVYYAVNKKGRELLKYGCAVLSGVLLSFAVFPAGVGQLFSEGENAGGGMFLRQLEIAFRYFFLDVFSLSTSDLTWALYAVPPVLGILLIMSLPVLFLFRRSRFVTAAAGRLMSLPGRISGASEKRPSLRVIKRLNPLPAAMALSAVTVISITAYTVSFLNLYVNRYLFLIYPVGFVFLFYLVYRLLSLIPGKWTRGIGLTVLVALMAANILGNTIILGCWTKNNDISMKETVSGSDVILVLRNSNEYGTLSEYSYELYNADEVFVTSDEDIAGDLKEIDKRTSDKRLYIAINVRDSGKDEKGRYMCFERKNNDGSYGIKNIYEDEYFSEIKKLRNVCAVEYAGEYVFMKGRFEIYRLG